ncbi:MAG: twin-arginine translocation signal domain-containing protein [Actinomycetota bacterium]
MTHQAPLPSRRRFLTGLGLTAAAAGILGPGALARAEGALAGNAVPYRSRFAADPGLVLVSIQLGGGMDFLDTVVPAGDPRYRALRQETLGEASLQPLDGDFSL